jgi:hypothetical protein
MMQIHCHEREGDQEHRQQPHHQAARHVETADCVLWVATAIAAARSSMVIVPPPVAGIRTYRHCELGPPHPGRVTQIPTLTALRQQAPVSGIPHVHVALCVAGGECQAVRAHVETGNMVMKIVAFKIGQVDLLQTLSSNLEEFDA